MTSGTVSVALVLTGQLPLGTGALQLCAAAGSASRASGSNSARHRNVAAYGITAWTASARERSGRRAAGRPPGPITLQRGGPAAPAHAGGCGAPPPGTSETDPRGHH